MVHPGKLRTTVKRLASRSLPYSGAPESLGFTPAYPGNVLACYKKLQITDVKILITLTFLREARNLPYSGTPKRGLTQVGSSLTRNL